MFYVLLLSQVRYIGGKVLPLFKTKYTEAAKTKHTNCPCHTAMQASTVNAYVTSHFKCTCETAI